MCKVLVASSELKPLLLHLHQSSYKDSLGFTELKKKPEIFERSMIPRQIWNWLLFQRISDVDSAAVLSPSEESVKNFNSSLTLYRCGTKTELSLLTQCHSYWSTRLPTATKPQHENLQKRHNKHLHEMASCHNRIEFLIHINCCLLCILENEIILSHVILSFALLSMLLCFMTSF